MNKGGIYRLRVDRPAADANVSVTAGVLGGRSFAGCLRPAAPIASTRPESRLRRLPAHAVSCEGWLRHRHRRAEHIQACVVLGLGGASMERARCSPERAAGPLCAPTARQQPRQRATSRQPRPTRIDGRAASDPLKSKRHAGPTLPTHLRKRAATRRPITITQTSPCRSARFRPATPSAGLPLQTPKTSCTRNFFSGAAVVARKPHRPDGARRGVGSVGSPADRAALALWVSRRGLA